MNRKRVELLVGLFLFVGLCMLAGLILKFGNFGDYFRPRYALELRYPSASGVLNGSEVRFSGVTIGRVSAPPRPNADFTGAIIELSIFDEYPVPKTSKISIETSGFLGDSYIAITPPKEPSTDYLIDGASVIGSPSGGLSALADSAGDISARGKEVVEDMRAALSELNSVLSKLDTGILSEDNITGFSETLLGLSDVVKGLNDGFLADENQENLKAALENFRKMSENLVASSEKISPILTKASTVVEKAGSAIDKADEGITEITTAARSVNVAVQRATQGPGLISALMNDAELRDDFEALISNMRETGILRYRDRGDGGSGVDAPPTNRTGIFRRNR